MSMWTIEERAWPAPLADQPGRPPQESRKLDIELHLSAGGQSSRLIIDAKVRLSFFWSRGRMEEQCPLLKSSLTSGLTWRRSGMGLPMHGLQAVLAGNGPIVPNLGLEIVPKGILYLRASGCPSVGSPLMGQSPESSVSWNI
jgi:hypothetical protein